MALEHQIEVNEMSVRHALANSFHSTDPGTHAWRGTTGTDATVVCDVLTGEDGRPYVRIWADLMDAPDQSGELDRVILIENANLVLGRLVHTGGRLRVEHGILAGTTMAAVEVQASVWTVGWTASAYAERIETLIRHSKPVPPVPEPPAALRRDAAYHVDITTRRVQRFLDERFGGFQHDPDWGYHGAFGSARVFVDVLPVLEDSTAVRASSPVLSDIDLGDELALELIRLGQLGPFGVFSYLPSRREVWFEHGILGDDLDQVELESAIEVVAEVADGQDDALAARFGGRRYADLTG